MPSSTAGKMPMDEVWADPSMLANLASKKMDFFAIHCAKRASLVMVQSAGRTALQEASLTLVLIA